MPGELNTPFAGLNLPGLPPGPATKSREGEPPGEPCRAADKPQLGRSLALPTKLGRVVLRKEKAHRGGKTVIIVHDFAPHITGVQIEEFARQLKKTCGCGGTVRDRVIEIQGDQPGKIRALLEAAGFRVAGV
jgi:translation initiation factor 1